MSPAITDTRAEVVSATAPGNRTWLVWKDSNACYVIRVRFETGLNNILIDLGSERVIRRENSIIPLGPANALERRNSILEVIHTY